MKLNTKLINNTQLITDRESLYQILPKNGVIAELGVARGRNAKSMICCEPSQFHLFDGDLKRIPLSDMKLLEESTSIHYHEGNDLDTLQQIPDHFFDWVYLDSSHTYDHTWKELQMLKDKIKPDGFICGHNYVTFDYRYWVCLTKNKKMNCEQAVEKCYYNLKACVNKFCNENDFELVYLTTELNPSFAIRRLK